MQKDIIDFINSQRICVLALEMLGGSPHGSTVHFAFDESSLTFFFATSKTYRKAEVLEKKTKTRASLVIGFDESNMKTLQIDGEALLVGEGEKELFDKVYFEKFPEKIGKVHGGLGNVFFKFVPTWWRYTDWTGKDGKKIITSADK